MTAERLRVGVNLLWLAPGRVGGSEEYMARQLAGLHDPTIDIALYCQPGFVEAYPGLEATREIVRLPVERDWRGLRVAAEHSWLALHSRHDDVVHHGGGTAPLVGKRPILLTVHDLQYRVFPGYFGSGRLRYLAAMMPRSVDRAAVVATPTNYVRTTVIEAFGIDPAVVVVVPHGIPDTAIPAIEAIEAARRRHGVGARPYVVYPAITHPHKGHDRLIAMLRQRDDDLGLVLIGGSGAAELALRESIAAAGVGDRVVRTGRIPAADRDALVSGAEALVFPSEYEGFGAPLVEAMTLGTPVVCSSAPAVVEVVGDAAIVVEDPDGWSSAVDEARTRRDELVAAGSVRRRVFTIVAAGTALAAAYRQAAAS